MAKRGPAAKPTVKRRLLKAAPRQPFPWLPLLLLLLTIGLFWVLPRRLGSPPVRVEFGQEER